MNKFPDILKVWLPLIILFFSINGYSQLNINTSLTPAQLVQDVLISGGVSISNVKFTGTTGATGQIGSFTTGTTATNLGLTSGVVLATGNVNHTAAAASTQMADYPGSDGDVDLNSLTTNHTYEAAVLEFDFVPTSNTVSFRYVFGSEEYPEFVCSSYNDVFGFFLSGPGITGTYTNNAVNIALIPGTSYPVAINTINNGSEGTWSEQACPSYGLNYSNLYINNTGSTIVFDGFTTVLTATHSVTPCQTYHIKIAIADVGDANYDSGVFLEANSFDAGGLVVTPSYSNTTFGNNAVEGCVNGIFAFTTATVQTTPLVINYTISGSATNGTDYTSIPTSVTIPAGSDSVAVVIIPTMDGLSEGNETVTLTVSPFCSTNVYTISIIDNTPLVAATAGDTSVCQGTTVPISVSGSGGMTPYTYNWSNSLGTGTSYNVTPNSTTTYTVTITDKCGATASNNVTVTINNNVSLSVTPTNPTICPGDPVSLTVTGAGNYTWSPATALSTTSGATVIANPTTTTTYSVSGSLNGCSGTGSVTVNVSNNMSVSITPVNPTICPGDPVTLTASGGASTYTWAPSTALSTTTGASVIASPTTTTTYTVTGTSGGCSGTASVTVNAVNNLAVSISPGNPTICLNGNVTLTASGGTNYTWSPSTGLSSTSGASVVASPTATTTYTVTGTSGGCSATASVTVILASNLTISVNPNPAEICPGANVSLTASGGQTYIWSPSTGLSSTTGTTVTAYPTTTQIYTVNGANNAGCTGSTTVTVNVSPISATTVSTDENCGHSNGTATVTPAGFCNDTWTYIWNTLPNQQTNPIATNLSAGTYTVSVYCGACVTTTSATVSNIPGPSVSIISITHTRCNMANGAATALATGGDGNYSYLWSNNQTGPSLTNVSGGTYYVTVTDGNSCQATNTVIINPSPVPIPAITGTINASCGFSDGSATVTATNGTAPYFYLWDNNTTSATLTNVPTGTYYVTVSDINSCTATISTNIGENPGPTVTASSENEVCDKKNGTATASANGGVGTFTYLWNDGQTTQTAIELVAGLYTVTISDGGCSASATVDVAEIPGPTASYTAVPKVLTYMDGPITFFDNSSGMIDSLFWEFGDGNYGEGSTISHQYENLGTYYVTLIIIDNNGCADTIRDSVRVTEIYTLYIPNSFTPNDDGFNDTWSAEGINVDPDNFRLTIYDRWGKEVFKTTKWDAIAKQSEGWNGTYNNSGNIKDVVMDVYVYRILCNEIDGPKHEYIGRISLIP